MKWTTSLTVIPMIVLSCFSVRAYAVDVLGVPPETVADYIHAVIESHRAFYTVHVVEALEDQGAAKAGGEWRTEKRILPLPVQVINETSQMFSTKVTGLRYQLISLWPINPKNNPRDHIGRNSLETLSARPERPITRTIKIDGQTYFRAIYADRAVSQTCISCHNSHPNSPKKDFQVGDIMGGLVIEFPMETR